ncbi:MAG: YceI family protein [Actinomycetes bacterium]
MSTDTKSLTGSYTVDVSHSQIGFGARHAMVTKVRGTFKDFAGTGYLDVENPANSKLEVTIQAASIDTRNADRDAHLKSNDFFSMEEFPVISFISTSFAKKDGNTYAVTGDLIIKGVSKSITIDLEVTGDAIDPWGNQRVGFEGATTINRTDWGVNFNAALEAGGVLVSEKISLEFEISAIKNAA